MGMIFDIQRFCIHDGPGIRTTVFFKGCPLNCEWCHNPESRSTGAQLAFNRQACTFCGECARSCKHGVHEISDNGHVVRFLRCGACGECIAVCPTKALRIIGREASPEEIIGTALRDMDYYVSGGGITLSGGEPLYQPDFALALLQKAKANGLHTCIETSGFCGGDVLARCIPFTDLFLFDFKFADNALHEKYIGASNVPILKNLRLLDDKGAAVILRCPVVLGINDSQGHFKAIAEWSRLSCIQQVELMPYHKLGESKAVQIGEDYAIGSSAASPDEVEKWKSDIRRFGCSKDIV